MNKIPGTVLTFLKDHAPKGGDLVGYWLDDKREYNVLILYQQGGEYRFSLTYFPQTVGHWGHQIGGNNYGVGDMKGCLDHGLWGADEATKERIRTIIDRVENGLSIDETIELCRKVCDPDGVLEPFKPTFPPRGPNLKYEAQYRVVRGLADALADPDVEAAKKAAAELSAMGITEDDGPLFAREALRVFRKRQSFEREREKAAAAPLLNEQKKDAEIAQTPVPEKVEAGKRTEGVRAVLAYVLMFLISPALVLVLGTVYGAALTAGKSDYIWAAAVAFGIWGFFAGTIRLCRFKRPAIVFAFALLTALGVVGWGHYVDYDWEAKDAIYQRVRHNIVPSGRWVPGTREYLAIQPGELDDYPADWKALDRDELYRRYLARELQDAQAGGFLDHLRVRAKKGFITAPYGKRLASYRVGLWVWWAWAVHAFLFFLAAVLSSAMSFMEREGGRT